MAGIQPETSILGVYALDLETRTVLLPGNVSLELVRIPAGTFVMGSPEDERGRIGGEGPQTLVSFTSGYWMGKTEVTQQQWLALMGGWPTDFNPDDYPAAVVDDDYPIFNVSWD
jgi:formylglycine-generating enzyme required for sulfatase activity